MVPLNFESLRSNPAVDIIRSALMILRYQERKARRCDEKLFLAVDDAGKKRQRRE